MRAETSSDSFCWLVIDRLFSFLWSFDRTHVAGVSIMKIMNKYLHAKTELEMNEAWNYRFWFWPHAATHFARHKSFRNVNSSVLLLFKEQQPDEETTEVERKVNLT